MTKIEKRNLLTITEVCDSFNRHNPEGILTRFAEDAVWITSRGYSPDGLRLTGKNEIRTMLQRRFAQIPDMSWEIHGHWVAGDRGCSEWTVTGNELNGNTLNWLGCDLWTLRDDGMIMVKDTYWKYAGGE